MWTEDFSTRTFFKPTDSTDLNRFNPTQTDSTDRITRLNKTSNFDLKQKSFENDRYTIEKNGEYEREEKINREGERDIIRIQKYNKGK